MRLLLSFLAAILLIFSVIQVFAGPGVPADRIQIVALPKLKVTAPKCQELLLTELQYGVFKEALEMHAQKNSAVFQDGIEMFVEHRVVIRGSTQVLRISKDQKDILQVLLATREPVAEFNLPAADQLIEDLNAQAIKKVHIPLINKNQEGYSLNWPALSEEEAADTSTEPVKLTPKQEILLTAVRQAPDGLLSYQELASVMSWGAGNPSHSAGTYVKDINLQAYIQQGRPLLQLVRSKGLALAKVSPREVPTVVVTKTTRLGPLEFTGNALTLSRFVNITAPPIKGHLLITSDVYEQMALSEAELIAAVTEINKASSFRHGKALIDRDIDLELLGYRKSYSWKASEGRFAEHGAWQIRRSSR